jgi:Tol biopolymer transport system component
MSVCFRILPFLLAGLALFAVPPAHATFPGRNGDIAYLCFQYDQLLSVCRVPSTGGAYRRVVSEAEGYTSAPRWAPNGRQILFKTTAEAGFGLVRMPGYRHIPGSEDLFEPAWAPRGDRVAAVSYSRRSAGIYTFDLNGRHRRLEIRGGRSPDWSPDGRQLAYSLRGEVYLYDLARRRNKRLTHSPAGSESGLPSWSPDGRRVAFDRRSGRDAGRSVNIFTVRANGSGLRQITHNQAMGPVAGDSDPTWSPDGRFIAFVHSPDNVTGFFLAVVNADGSNQRTLTGPPGYYGALAPDWGRRPR